MRLMTLRIFENVETIPLNLNKYFIMTSSFVIFSMIAAVTVISLKDSSSFFGKNFTAESLKLSTAHRMKEKRIIHVSRFKIKLM